MGGLAFLMKKGWHPNTNENKKAVFMAEKEAELRVKREEDAAREVRKERELQAIEEAGDIATRDPREASLKFMYAFPAKQSDEDEEEQLSVSAPAAPRATRELSLQDEDPDVMLFHQKVARKQGLYVGDEQGVSVDRSKSKSRSSCKSRSSIDRGGAVDSRPDTEDPEKEALFREREHLKQQPGFGRSSQYSTLEAVVGRKRRLGLTQDEQAERHPSLKNAPVEGEYARNVEVRHKPFAQVIRNVQCFRCGQWGHAAGDRECPQASFNPHDHERRRREDPLTFMRRHSHPKPSTQPSSQPQVTLKQAALPAELRLQMVSESAHSRNSAVASPNTQQILAPQGEELGVKGGREDQDSEAAYLESLSSKNKIKLLRRLEVIEAGGDAGSKGNRGVESRGLAQRLESGGLRALVEASSDDEASDSGSDNSSSSSSRSSENTGSQKHRHQKQKKKQRRNKHERDTDRVRHKKSKKKKKHKHKR